MFENQGKLGRSPRLNSKMLLFGAGVLIVILAAVAGFFIWRTVSLSQNPNASNEQKSVDVTTQVGKIFALPDEKPTVAQITDKNKVKDQLFFAPAQDGDYLLVFENAKFALIYRESDHKIINAGPISNTGQTNP